MTVLKIESTDDTPGVMFDKDNGIFEISGRSLPEDASSFFEPVIEWIENYKRDPNIQTEFTFKMEYFNTASSKFIQDIITSLEKMENIKIVWCFQPDDENMEETGQEFSELVDIPFEFKNY
jgi:hypothetical protein